MSGRKSLFRLLAVLGALVALAALATLAWWLFWVRPETVYEAATSATEAELKALELRDKVLTTGAQLFLGVAVFVGAFFTWRRVRALEKQAESAHQGQLTERFTRAIEQLGNKEPAICLGGIYALERIAKDSERDHPQVMEVLCAFVRERTGLDDEDEDLGLGSIPPPSTTVQAALEVIGRNPREGLVLNLEGVVIPKAQLHRADLAGANLRRAQLNEANLTGANLTEGALERADLFRANLTDANLTGANLFLGKLKGAKLGRARLSGANLWGAELWGAKLEGAILEGADLGGAKLTHARGLTREQIETALVDENTQLPEGLLDQLSEGGKGSARSQD